METERTRWVDWTELGLSGGMVMFKSAFNNVFRAGLHALAYQHVTALKSQVADADTGLSCK